MKRLIILVLVVSVILGVLFWKYGASLLKKEDQKPIQVNLTYWDLEDNEVIFKSVIESFEKSHPNTKIAYVKQSSINYRTRVQTQIRASQGPDIFTLHSSWVPMFLVDLYPAPASLMSVNDFNNTFYPLAKDTLIMQNKIYATPKEVDGLVMFYNEDILKAAGVSVPKTWQEFVSFAAKVTVKNQQGQIQTAGAALGTTGNIDFWPEILGLLFLQQPGASLMTPNSQDAAEVLQFYTSFVLDPKNKTWDTTLPTSTQMFKDGRLAFYFAPASEARDIRQANLNLPFKTALVPQLPGKNISYGGFWAQGVSIKSQNPTQAWEFLNYLNSPQALQFIYDQKAQTGFFGKPYPRVDMASLLSQDEVMGTAILQAPTFKGWFLNSGIPDNGLNDEIISLYQGAINDVLGGRLPTEVLQTITPKIQPIFDKYKAK